MAVIRVVTFEAKAQVGVVEFRLSMKGNGESSKQVVGFRVFVEVFPSVIKAIVIKDCTRSSRGAGIVVCGF